MNDVLPKPFTKEGMLKALEKHLPGFKKNAFQQQFQMQSGFATPTTSQPPLGLTIGQLSAPTSIKDEQSPGKSPNTAGSWHSPNQPIAGQQPMSHQQMPQQSPIGNAPNNFMQHPLAQTPMTQHAMPQQSMQQHSMPTTPLNGPSSFMAPHPQQHQLPHPQQQQYQSGPLTPGLSAGPRGPIGGPQPTHRRVMSDMTGGPAQDEHPDKRQRMYAPQSAYQQ
jgi:osomolarity two-component system response regulator SKN7